MSQYETITWAIDDGIGRLTFDRPDNRNGITGVMMLVLAWWVWQGLTSGCWCCQVPATASASGPISSTTQAAPTTQARYQRLSTSPDSFTTFQQ